MNEQVKKQAKLLLKEIVNSTEYMDFINLKKTISYDEGMYEKINNYRRRLFELQCDMFHSEDQFEAISALNRDNEQLLSTPLVSDFITAELKLSKMMSKVYDIISEGIEFDMDFLN